ncbi:MAG: hypothetical protein Unbinned5123contig1000_20 [Prokaryotic dsDNA virus sp.]|nr:MAG: hypothetical protein Unbinned5123contig1000_20 [Prokaryotic dsDNA virus sp.]|tara:strand:- start:32942 stop:33094 length:153 start_codon:yes stop_codon:yes gene_type:complete
MTDTGNFFLTVDQFGNVVCRVNETNEITTVPQAQREAVKLIKGEHNEKDF